MACITLFSDFGLQDASVAIAKGVLMQYMPGAAIIDISHEVTPFHTAQAAYLFGTVFRKFPQGSAHVLLFDLFSEAAPRLLLCQYEGHYFLAPDNGLLPLALGTATAEAWLCFEMKKELAFSDWLSAAGRVIHSLQTEKPTALGLPALKLKTIPDKSAARFEGDTIFCEVIHIDHYENVVVNITRERFDAWVSGRPFRLQFMGMEEIGEVSNNYHDVREGFKLCRFNNNGYLEICVNRGKAASLFGLRLGGKHNNIKITFE